MKIIKGRADGAPTETRTQTFTGLVLADPVLAEDGNVAAKVFFAPGARTFWHSHEKGQLLSVISGSGLICSHGGPVETIEVGDVIWVPPGERHWHGGSPSTSMMHLAVSLGTTQWLDEVAEEHYGGAR
jgi:quercetin dioxygenase-like cupin family protein